MQDILSLAVQHLQIRQVDRQAALFLKRISKNYSADLLLIAALASQATGEGHTCLPLVTIAGTILSNETQYRLPSLNTMRLQLQSWDVVGTPEEKKPLILDEHDKLYLGKYYLFQKSVSRRLIMQSQEQNQVDHGKVRPVLEKLFPGKKKLDWQKIAAAMGLLKNLLIISGGPGTGKTYTVARILALLQTYNNNSLRIGLSAPTGKAANRLQESIGQAKTSIDGEFASFIPENGQTLHRLLAYHPDRGFQYNKDNPLHLDLLVLDEASMVDISLMYFLLEALPKHAGLIILGDRNQLASVEAGNFFADLCGSNDHNTQWSTSLVQQLEQLTDTRIIPSAQATPFSDAVIHLRDSYRFHEESGIGKFARATNHGNKEKTSALLQKQFDDLLFFDYSKTQIPNFLEEKIIPLVEKCLQAKDCESALLFYSRFRILCALRDGATGVAGLNRDIENILKKRGLIPKDLSYYQGQALMIQQNHYGLQLYNGDMGVIWPDKNNTLLAWFLLPDKTLYSVSPARLPQHATAYAITVHKSQGSEFDQVFFFLPQESIRVLNRELIYTAVTRAKKQLTLIAEPNTLLAAIENKSTRHSGLGNLLWHNEKKRLKYNPA